MSKLTSYHGTSTVNASTLAAGTVNVTKGGGELGRGFYTGEHLFEAKAWAYHVSSNKQRNVVEFEIDDAHVEALSLEVLDYGTAVLTRHRLREKGAARTHLFGLDMVWAPIVGSDRANGDQYKWESSTAEALLNGGNTTRKVI